MSEYCTGCGGPTEPGDRFCGTCGTAVRHPAPRRRGPTWVVAVAVCAVVVVAAGLVVAATRDNGHARQVVLEGRDAPGEAPFTPTVAQAPPDQVQVFLASAPGASDTVGAVPGEPTARAAVVTGSTPGLYGGSGDNAVCDVGALIEFLEAAPEKAEAWAEAARIEPGDLRSYLQSLVPAVLPFDTLVVNHGFADGRATPRDAVLEAGTAVLVDESGTPRARCSCGNPLAEPTDLSTDVEFEGDPWEGFDDRSIGVIEAADAPLDSLELVSIDDGELISVGLGDRDAIRSVDFENFAYTSTHPVMFEPCWPATFTTTDGIGDYSPEMTVDFRRVVGEVLYGDLDGDAREEAVVHLGCGIADNIIHEFQIFSWDGAAPVHMADVGQFSTIEGDAFDAVRLEGSTLVLDFRRDPSLTPFYAHVLPMQQRVTWDGSAYVTEETTVVDTSLPSLQDNSLGPLVVGMSEADAVATGWLGAPSSDTCEAALDLDLPPNSADYRIDGPSAPSGTEGLVEVRGGVIQIITVSAGALVAGMPILQDNLYSAPAEGMLVLAGYDVVVEDLFETDDYLTATAPNGTTLGMYFSGSPSAAVPVMTICD